MSLKTLVSKVKSGISQVGAAIKAADVKAGGSYGTPLSKQLLEGAKTASVAIPITKAAELPAVSAKAVTAAKGAAAAIGSSVKTTVSKAPVTSAAVATFGAGYIIENPKALKSAADIPEALFEGGAAAGKATTEKSIGPLIDYAKEHPIAAGAAGVGAAYLVGKGAAGALVTSKILEDKTPSAALPTEAATSGATLPTTGTGAQAQPITPETQIIGKSVTSAAKYRRKGRVKPENRQHQSIRINILNQSHLKQNRKFIY